MNMSEKKKHTIYSAVDIQKYLSGEMNISEMYAIEKAALDDPLLAEAIEGYEVMEQKDWSRELSELKEKLTPAENKTVLPIYSFRKWWRIAAAVVIIGSGIVITYLFNSKNPKNSPNIAKTTTLDSAPVIKTDSLITANNSSTVPGTVANDSQENLSIATAKNKPGSTSNDLLAEAKKENKPDSKLIYKPSAGNANANNKDIAAINSNVENSSKKNSEPPGENTSNVQSNEISTDKGLSIQNQTNNAADNYVTARVVTADDKPVAFANVSIQKNKSSVHTDAKGNFTIPARDSNINVVVTSAGYIPQKFSIKNSATENKIVLQQDTIDLTTLTSSKSKSIAKPMLRKEIENEEEDDAEPAIGWDEYNNYISNNLVFPSEAKQKNIHGVVEVFVKLKENGDISQVKVNKPLCPECDAEAIRLVKEGPKWEVKKDKAKKAKVKIRF